MFSLGFCQQAIANLSRASRLQDFTRLFVPCVFFTVLFDGLSENWTTRSLAITGFGEQSFSVSYSIFTVDLFHFSLFFIIVIGYLFHGSNVRQTEIVGFCYQTMHYFILLTVLGIVTSFAFC